MDNNQKLKHLRNNMQMGSFRSTADAIIAIIAVMYAAMGL